MSDVSLVTNLIPTVNEGFITTVGGSGVTSGGATVPLTSMSGLTNGTIFVGIVEPGQTNQQVFTGTVDTGGSQITGVKWTRGLDVAHPAGKTVVDYVTGTDFNMLAKAMAVHVDQDGTLKAGAVDVAAVLASNVVTTAKILDANVTTAKVADAAITPPKWTNPYKFSAYRSAGWTTPTGFGKVTPDTELYDSNSNFASGTYTAPISGFYHFDGSVGETGTLDGAIRIATLYKNGVEACRGTEFTCRGTANTTANVSGDIQLTAGDTIELYTFGGAKTGSTGIGITRLNGHLVSLT